MAVCIPLVCGFPEKFNQDAPEQGRLCPKCNNASVVGGSQRTWFEFFWIPLIPFSSHRVWLCSICRWEMRQGAGPDPQPPSAYGGYYAGNNRPPPPQSRPPPPQNYQR